MLDLSYDELGAKLVNFARSKNVNMEFRTEIGVQLFVDTVRHNGHVPTAWSRWWGSKEREWYEGDLCWKIENVVAQEGAKRVERAEPKGQWVQRMRNAGFRGVGFSEDGVAEVKGMLEEHAAGWGLKREEEDLVLTWKGHNVVFANVWVPTRLAS
ncbi:hypothetical protein C3L33_18475, partial [Rhododendron williamsianum]